MRSAKLWAGNFPAMLRDLDRKDESRAQRLKKDVLDMVGQNSKLLETLELAFANKLIRSLCENEAQAFKTLGARVAEKLNGRLADLYAAQCVNDLVAGNPCEMNGALLGHMSISLCDGFKIVFCANHLAKHVHTSSKVNWSKVTRIKIIEVKKI